MTGGGAGRGFGGHHSRSLWSEISRLASTLVLDQFPINVWRIPIVAGPIFWDAVGLGYFPSHSVISNSCPCWNSGEEFLSMVPDNHQVQPSESQCLIYSVRHSMAQSQATGLQMQTFSNSSSSLSFWCDFCGLWIVWNPVRAHWGALPCAQTFKDLWSFEGDCDLKCISYIKTIRFLHSYGANLNQSHS